MTYDWNEPLPPCDWCGEDATEECDWFDRLDFWGHPECYRAQQHRVLAARLASGDHS